MSSNTPNQPGDGSDRENTPLHGREDPLASNPYSSQYQQSAAPDLDANAPTLKSSDLRRMNRRALFYLAAIVVLLLAIAFWLIKGPSSKAPPPKQAETITVPVAPVAPPLPLPTPSTQAIPFNTAPPLPPIALQHANSQPARPQGPSLLERRLVADQGNSNPETSAAPVANQPRGAGDVIGNMEDAKTSAEPLTNPDTVMVRGTFIRCVLQTRIISDYPGFASCGVTEPVYSFTGKRLLLPKGSKVLGKYRSSPIIGNRLFVIWDRIITPTGIDVNMSSPGTDDLGSSGDPGYLDSHWGSRISAALLVSMLSDAFLYEGEKHGPTTNTIGASGAVVEQPFQSNTAQTLQSLANQAVQQSANRPATVTINQGTVIEVYVAKDVDFSGVVSKF
ncbi:TrbI/VirB10 family protein [Rhodanobacter sp. L36]|uniref:TrbI/VirB10 family protein n=1 Tax=Rhodanobacter sp. L36 TaxID=1747221 RepID=UPI00131B4199|nr:TrbI/VirB10 family protein [Rhodanobacter sp. L36]